MKRLPTIVAALSALLLVAPLLAAQRPTRRAPESAGRGNQTGVAIALRLGGASYQFSGQASCTHAPKASIYDVVGQQWHVEQREAAGSLSLTLWRPASGAPDMFSLHVSQAGRSHVTNTVTVGGQDGKRPAEGAGKVTVTPTGPGGTFTIDATAADGTKITGTIKCDAFMPAMPEGGH